MSETYRVYRDHTGRQPGSLDGCELLGEIDVPDRTPLAEVARLAQEQYGAEVLLEGNLDAS